MILTLVCLCADRCVSLCGGQGHVSAFLLPHAVPTTRACSLPLHGSRGDHDIQTKGEPCTYYYDSWFVSSSLISQHACGYEYTARLQRMVVDIRLSTDTMTAFQESLAAQGDTLPMSFSTMVLQSAAWPLQKSTCTVHIPPNLQLAKTKVGYCDCCE